MKISYYLFSFTLLFFGLTNHSLASSSESALNIEDNPFFNTNSDFFLDGEDCSIAIPLNIDDCILYHNVGATTDVNEVDFDTPGINCPASEHEIWFSFVSPTIFMDLEITITGITNGVYPAMNQPRVALATGLCPTFLETHACADAVSGSNTVSLTIPYQTLIPGFTYYILVSDWSDTALSNEGAFNLCLQPPPPSTGDECVGTFYDSGGQYGNYTNNENSIISICPNEAFECLELNITYDMETYNGTSGDLLEVKGFVPDIASEVTLATLTGVNQEGVIISSAGCVDLHFQSDESITSSGFMVEWSCSMNSCFDLEPDSLAFLNISASSDTICPNECVDLVVAPPLINETTDYLVDQIQYTPFPSINDNQIDLTNASFLNFNGDDAWSSAIDLPFDFCFYGNSYNQVVVGTNGVVSFDIATYADGYNQWSINDPIPGNPYMLNAIACPFHDLNPGISTNGGVYYAIYGTAPFRVAVFSFSDVSIFSCQTTSTQQIALYESTNIIDTYISNKPICASWNNGAAIHGIQNADGSLATVVPGRNYPTQWAASNDAWRFSPNGATASNVNVNWYDEDNNLIGNGENITVCVDETSDYITEITYESSTGTACLSPLILSDTITIIVASDLSINTISTTDASGFGLADGEIAIEGIGGEAPYHYIWSNGENTPTISDLLAGAYSVSLTDADGCFAEAMFTIVSPPLLEIIIIERLGDIDGQGTGSITIDVIGGVSPYTFLWRTADGTDISTDMNPTGLSANLYRVFVTDFNGVLAESELVEVEVLVDVADLSLSSQISLSPNPAKGNINLEITSLDGNDAQVVITDLVGREISRQGLTSGNNLINVGLLAEGVYFFRVQIGKRFIVKKVVIKE